MMITVVGSGFVGQTAAMRLLEKGLGEVVLIDIIEGKPQGLALDLKEAARILDVPVMSTVQNPDRMGGIDERFELSEPISKMAFSCAGSGTFREGLESHGRKSIVLVGIETHICVTLTALDLLREGYQVFVCPDAVSARSNERHKLGMERMRDAGVMPTHTETLVYEWMAAADHPKFREVLQVVKSAK